MDVDGDGNPKTNEGQTMSSRKMKKPSTIDGFFKRKFTNNFEASSSLPTSSVDVSISTNQIQSTLTPSFRVEINDVDIGSLERDPGKRPQIWDYNINQHDDIRRAYINFGPCQPKLSVYPKSGPITHRRSFQDSWFNIFPLWLEYSLDKDAAFCLPCFLFCKPSGLHTQRAFTIDGFKHWKKVRNGQNCAFLNHVGKDPNSSHKVALRSYEDLKNQSQHISKVVDKYNSQQISENRLRLKASIDSVLWLALGGCAFRGHDESLGSRNRGNFLRMIKILGKYNEKVGELIDKSPRHATYTSPQIQKEILHIVSTKVKTTIREEIGDAKFCIIVDESRDESKREQMSIVLRFVDKDGLVKERFFGLVHVLNTAALTLQKGIYSVLSHHNLCIQNIRGQGYDGASNMRGEWNGLQSLILKDCPYAYYVHCLAHRLQLALVAASKEVIVVDQFFTKLSSIVNIIGASCKRSDEFQIAQAAEIEHMISIDELETGRGLNQIGTLQRAGDTRWSSHLRSVSSLIKMYSATYSVLINIIDDGAHYSVRSVADTAYEGMTTFEFVFILHLMKEVLEITDLLCQALQCQSQDIVNAMELVSSTKKIIQKLRDDGWNALLTKVNSFCEARNIDLLDMNARFVGRRGRARHQQGDFTIEQHYKLLVLSSALDPREGQKSFRIDDICQLVDKFYPKDFTDHDKIHLRIQLQHYEHNVVRSPEFKSLTTLSELCKWLAQTRRSIGYPLVYRVIELVLTLPVSTATTERSFSAMHIVKTRLRTKMDDDFLSNSLMVFIENEIVEKFTMESIIDDFRDFKERRATF